MMRGKDIFFLCGIIITVAMIVLIFRNGTNDPLAPGMPSSERRATNVAKAPQQDAVPISEKAVFVLTQQTEIAPPNTVEPSDESVKSETILIKVAGREFPLLFEDPDISDTLKSVIGRDITLNLAHFKHVTLRDVSGERSDSEHRSSLKATHLLDEGCQERLFPEVFENNFGGVIVSNSTPHIVVCKKLIEEYERALDYKTRHPVMFKRLEEFLARLRSAQFLKTIEDNPEKAQNAFFLERGPNEGVDYSQQLSGLLRNATIRDPSILDFYPSENYGIKQGTVCMPLLIWPDDMNSEPVLKGIPLFIYIDGEWRIYVPRLL
jgi:hypothetical protein